MASGSAVPAPVDPTRKYLTIYPIYVNSKKTVAEGRRIAAEKGVENPTVQEVADVCKYLKLDVEIQADKCYSRDYMQRGRVKVRIKDENNQLINPDIKSKKDLLLKLGALIAKLASRANAKKDAGSAGAAAAGGKAAKKKR
eukprot:tig00000404_g393.t1